MMRSSPRWFYTFILSPPLFLAIWLPSSLVEAEDGSIWVESTVEFTFGENMTFSLRVDTAGTLTDIKLVVLDGDGVSDVVSIDVPVSETVSSFDVQVVRDLEQKPIPPFSEIEYWWVTTVDLEGSVRNIETEHFKLEYLDNRFDWQSAQRGAITLYWYEGDLTFGHMAADVASRSLNEISIDLAVDPPDRTHIYVYSTGDHLRSGIQMDGREWVGGHAHPDLGVALVVISPGGSASLDMRRKIPHELTHVILYRMLGDGYFVLPAWLNEGLAVRYESDPSPAYDQILQTAYRDDTLISFASLCATFPMGGDDAALAYSQSGSFVDYISTHWGKSKLRDLILTYRDGAKCGSGVQRALAKDINGLQLDWQAKVLMDDPLRLVWLRGRSWLLLFLVPAFVVASCALWPFRKLGSH